MTRRKWLVSLLLLAVLAIGGTYAAVWLTAPTPGLTEANALSLRAGMTVHEVETLFGFPGDLHYFPAKWRVRMSSEKWYVWGDADGLRVSVMFDKNWQLTSASIGDRYTWSEIKVNETFLDCLRRIL